MFLGLKEKEIKKRIRLTEKQQVDSLTKKQHPIERYPADREQMQK
nr:MAG TPA: hypothetical protein [Caudoviricetes sp.]